MRPPCKINPHRPLGTGTQDSNTRDSRRKPSRAELRSPSPQTQAKLGELSELPGALLNSLNPSNIKRFSSDFIKEWEKSLSPPPETTTFEASFQQRIHEQASS